MRLKESVHTIISEDDAQISRNTDMQLRIDDNSLTWSSSRIFIVPALGANVAIAPAISPAKYMTIVAYSSISVRVNDAAAPLIPLDIIPAADASALSDVQKADQPAIYKIGPTAITSLYLTNLSTTDSARVYVAFAG